MSGKSIAGGKVEERLFYHAKNSEREGHYKCKIRLMTNPKDWSKDLEVHLKEEEKMVE